MTYDSLPIHHFSQDIKKVLKKGKTKGLLYGNFGACNLGDEAILSGELSELQKIPTTKVTVVSRFPEKVKKLHNTQAIYLKNIPVILKEIFFSNYIIFGGGGLLCKNDAGLRGILFQIYTIILFLYVPLLFQKKIFVIGLGFYKNVNPLVIHLAILGLFKATLIATRDLASYTFLKSKHLNVKLYKDNSFLMPLSQNKVHHKGVTKFYIVGIAVNAPQRISDREKLEKEIANFMNLNAHTTHFVFYSLDTHPLYYHDKKFAKQILKRVQKDVSFTFFPSIAPQEIFSSFISNDFMITSRLHGSIFSYRLGVPFYAIAYDTKCDSFLNSIGHQYTHPSSVSSKDISFYFEVAKMKKNEQVVTRQATMGDATYDY